MVKVCHVTSAHERYDVRIFHKECKSLAANGYEVILLVNDGQNDEIIDNIKVKSTGFEPHNRYQRMIVSQRLIKNLAMQIDAEVYHLHDPELLLLAPSLIKRGKKVIFDSHEDYISTIPEKSWLPRLMRPLIGFLYGWYEKYILKRIAGAIVCYHWTEQRYKNHCARVEMILNFPAITHRPVATPDFSARNICYAGGISAQWCHHVIMEALSKMPTVGYELAGGLRGDYGKKIKQMVAWEQVNYHGTLSHKEVFEKPYSNASIGMALLDYIPQCKGTIGNMSNTKLFEYMYAGLAVICTDFSLWKGIIEKEKCGITVNPQSVDEVVTAISTLIGDPEKARKMGMNGRKAVLREYNWKTQEKKLLNIYSSILSG